MARVALLGYPSVNSPSAIAEAAVLADRLTIMLYLVIAGLVLSGVALGIAGWCLVMVRALRADAQRAGAAMAPPGPSMAVPQPALAPAPLEPVFRPGDGARGSVPSEEPPEPQGRTTVWMPGRRR